VGADHEPFGTLVLAIAVTVIEASLIVSLMLSGGKDAATLARDTVFAAVMLILNGIVGLCLLAGGLQHHEQRFTLRGVSATLCVLAAMAVLTLVLPNYTSTTSGPTYAPAQMVFVAVVALVLYMIFVLVQTVRHRDYFLPAGGAPDDHATAPTNGATWSAFAMLLVALVAVVLLGKGLSSTVEAAVLGAGLPVALVGVVIAALVLAPESLAAFRAARADRLQTSLNLALGSALATIGLTIPTVAIMSLALGLPLSLGIDARESCCSGYRCSWRRSRSAPDGRRCCKGRFIWSFWRLICLRQWCLKPGCNGRTGAGKMDRCQSPAMPFVGDGAHTTAPVGADHVLRWIGLLQQGANGLPPQDGGIICVLALRPPQIFAGIIEASQRYSGFEPWR
jgi:Ca2+:H+ antiporter